MSEQPEEIPALDEDEDQIGGEDVVENDDLGVDPDEFEEDGDEV